MPDWLHRLLLRMAVWYDQDEARNKAEGAERLHRKAIAARIRLERARASYRHAAQRMSR